MGKKIRGGVAQKSHKVKKENRLKPETYKSYIISFVKTKKLMKIGGKFIDNPVEWHVKGERGYEATKEEGLEEAKKYIRKRLK